MTSVYQDVRNKVRERTQGNDKKVWLTGHSLGAALAVCTAHRLRAFGGVEVQGVITFGSPRIGNQRFVEAYQPLHARTQRWNNFGDVIAGLPPAHPGHLTGYRHVGRTHYIEADRSVRLNQSERVMPPIVGNHDMRKYIWAIFNATPASTRGKLVSPMFLGVTPV
jgi:pimeloyl-ACP methyl ester carboxylesterase